MAILFFEWYLIDLPKKIYKIWSNYLWFFKNFFSIPDLLKTFFDPWKRYSFSSKGGFNIEEWFGNLVFNIFSRFMGALMRIVMIIFGTLAEIIVVILGILSFAGWIVFPIFLIFCLIWSL